MPMLFVGGPLKAQVHRAPRAVSKPSRKVPPRIRPATVQGDVYVVMASGDIKRAAGNTVYLIRDNDSLTTALGSVCSAYKLRYNQLNAANTAASQALTDHLLAGSTGEDAKYRELKAADDAASRALFANFDAGVASIRAVLGQFTFAQSGTGMNAHYTFANVPPGGYHLFAETRIGQTDLQWWTSIHLAPGDTISKDLDPSTLANGSLYCGIR